MAKNWQLFLIVYFHFSWYGIIWLIKSDQESLTPFLAIGGWVIAMSSKESRSPSGQRHYAIALLASLFGCLFDFIVWKSGGIIFESSSVELIDVFPLWMSSIWILFASVIPVTSFAFRTWRSWAGLAGAIGGPLSYWLAQQLGVLRFSSLAIVSIYIVFWGVFFQLITNWLTKTEKSTGRVL